jgi:MFS family permease
MVKRPVYFALVGSVFRVGATTGPIFGGIFADLMAWSWCFFFDLPMGGAAIAVLLFFFKAKEQGNNPPLASHLSSEQRDSTIWERSFVPMDIRCSSWLFYMANEWLDADHQR